MMSALSRFRRRGQREAPASRRRANARRPCHAERDLKEPHPLLRGQLLHGPEASKRKKALSREARLEGAAPSPAGSASSRPSERGMALILVLSSIAVLTAVAVDFAY